MSESVDFPQANDSTAEKMMEPTDGIASQQVSVRPKEVVVPSATNAQLQTVRRQVDEVVEVMKRNIEGIQAREQSLNELEQRADVLNQHSREFATTSHQIQKKMWWKNLKWTIIGVATATTIAIVIIIIVAVNVTPK